MADSERLDVARSVSGRRVFEHLVEAFATGRPAALITLVGTDRAEYLGAHLLVEATGSSSSTLGDTLLSAKIGLAWASGPSKW